MYAPRIQKAEAGNLILKSILDCIYGHNSMHGPLLG